MAALKI